MNVIAPATLRAFYEVHPNAKAPLREWRKAAQKGRFLNFAELRAVFPSADYLQKEEITIFNIGGNNYRLVTFVRYSAQSIYIKLVMTHAEYTKWNRLGRPL